MITQQMVSEKLLAYLDNQLSLDQILTWAKQVLADGNYAPDSNIHLLPSIVLSLEGADHPPIVSPVVRNDAA